LNQLLGVFLAYAQHGPGDGCTEARVDFIFQNPASLRGHNNSFVLMVYCTKKPSPLIQRGRGDDGLSRYLNMIPVLLRILEVGRVDFKVCF
jgi:hypothetical protein